MCVADIPFKINDTIQGHAAQLEKIHFLFVHSGDPMIGIRQTRKGNSFSRPILLEGCRRIGTDRQDRDIMARKFYVLITQARQLRAAIQSHEPAQERKHNWFTAAKIG